jgi:hypothetical protein
VREDLPAPAIYGKCVINTIPSSMVSKVRPRAAMVAITFIGDGAAELLPAFDVEQQIGAVVGKRGLLGGDESFEGRPQG